MARSVGCITTLLAISLLGNPITGLKNDDFTAKEGGVWREVRLFEAHILTPETPSR